MLLKQVKAVGDVPKVTQLGHDSPHPLSLSRGRRTLDEHSFPPFFNSSAAQNGEGSCLRLNSKLLYSYFLKWEAKYGGTYTRRPSTQEDS